MAEVIVPGVDAATKLFEDDAIVAALRNDPRFVGLEAPAPGTGTGSANTLPPVVYRTGNGTATDPWETPENTLVPLEWRGPLPRPTAANGFLDRWDTYRRVDVALPRPTLPASRS